MSEDILEGTKEAEIGRCLLEHPGVLPISGPKGEMLFLPLINHTYPDCTCKDFEPTQEAANEWLKLKRAPMPWIGQPDMEERQCRHCGYFRPRVVVKVEPKEERPKSTVFTFPGAGASGKGN